MSASQRIVTEKQIFLKEQRNPLYASMKKTYEISHHIIFIKETVSTSICEFHYIFSAYLEHNHGAGNRYLLFLYHRLFRTFEFMHNKFNFNFKSIPGITFIIFCFYLWILFLFFNHIHVRNIIFVLDINAKLFYWIS